MGDINFGAITKRKNERQRESQKESLSPRWGEGGKKI